VTEALCEAAEAVAAALARLDDWGPAGRRPGQYRSDLVADEAAVSVLDRAGLGVLSEESGLHRPDRAVLVVVDPLDGSTNAARGIPWYATSLCALDDAGPLAALVEDLARGRRYLASRGEGAERDGRPIRPSACKSLDAAVLAVNGLPPRHLGWRQYRSLGAAALELCAVADGTFDAFLDATTEGLAPWDYLGGLLVCEEAGAEAADRAGEALLDQAVALRGLARRAPSDAPAAAGAGSRLPPPPVPRTAVAAAATPPLLHGLLRAWQTPPPPAEPPRRPSCHAPAD
jgi:myo-inositol-1(or 4)-monophosphatase